MLLLSLAMKLNIELSELHVIFINNGLLCLTMMLLFIYMPFESETLSGGTSAFFSYFELVFFCFIVSLFFFPSLNESHILHT